MRTKKLSKIFNCNSKEELEKALTDKQRVFCYEYVIDFNATSAAKRAGYSEKTSYSIGQENLKKPEIKKYVEMLIIERSERTKIDQDWVVKKIVDIIEKSMQHKPVLDREGNPVMVQTPNGELAAAYIFDGKTALTGLSMLTEHLPDRKNQEEGNKTGSVEITLNNYLGQANNTYFPVTPETEHLAKLLGIDVSKK
jgi:phage terminase small subunit